MMASCLSAYRSLHRMVGNGACRAFCPPYELSRLALRRHRLKADLHAMPGGLGEAVERAGRGAAAAAFEAGDGALRGLHAPRQLGLAQPRAAARLGDFGGERELLLQRVVFLAVCGVLHPLLVQSIELDHLTSLARWRAMSSSRAGVFCDFFTKARRIM